MALYEMLRANWTGFKKKKDVIPKSLWKKFKAYLCENFCIYTEQMRLGKGIFVIFYLTWRIICHHKLLVFFIFLLILALRAADYYFVCYCLDYQTTYFEFLPLKWYQLWRYSPALKICDSKIPELVKILMEHTPLQNGRSAFFESAFIDDPELRAQFFTTFQKEYIEQPYRKLTTKEMGLILEQYFEFELRVWNVFLGAKNAKAGTLLSQLMMERIKPYYDLEVDKLNQETYLSFQTYIDFEDEMPDFAYFTTMLVCIMNLIPFHCIPMMRSFDSIISENGLDLMRLYLETFQVTEVGAQYFWDIM